MEVINEVGRQRAAKEIKGSPGTQAGAKEKVAMVVVSLSTLMQTQVGTMSLTGQGGLTRANCSSRGGFRQRR